MDIQAQSKCDIVIVVEGVYIIFFQIAMFYIFIIKWKKLKGTKI